MFPVRYFVYDQTYWLGSVVVASTLAFDYFSKEWLITPPKRRSLKRRVATLYLCGVIYLTLFASYFYFNGKITDSEGDEVPVYEALANAYKSPWWTDLKNSFSETWRYAQHNGYYETWKQIIDLLDADGEQNAYKVCLLYTINYPSNSKTLNSHTGPGSLTDRVPVRDHLDLPEAIARESSGQGQGIAGGKANRPGAFHGDYPFV